MAVRLLVADDEPDVRLLMRLSLGLYDGLEIVAEAVDGLDAARLAAECHPDVVVLDWRMPRVSGLEAIPLIRQAAPGAHILMYTSQPSRQSQDDALAAGADGYLEKTAGTEALVAALRRLAAQATVTAPDPRTRPNGAGATSPRRSWRSTDHTAPSQTARRHGA